MAPWRRPDRMLHRRRSRLRCPSFLRCPSCRPRAPHLPVVPPRRRPPLPAARRARRSSGTTAAGARRTASARRAAVARLPPLPVVPPLPLVPAPPDGMIDPAAPARRRPAVPAAAPAVPGVVPACPPVPLARVPTAAVGVLVPAGATQQAEAADSRSPARKQDQTRVTHDATSVSFSQVPDQDSVLGRVDDGEVTRRQDAMPETPVSEIGSPPTDTPSGRGSEHGRHVACRSRPSGRGCRRRRRDCRPVAGDAGGAVEARDRARPSSRRRCGSPASVVTAPVAMTTFRTSCCRCRRRRGCRPRRWRRWPGPLKLAAVPIPSRSPSGRPTPASVVTAASR